ncbi:BON domain-containing protein [Paraburkholderia sp. JHI869]|uniref:BON domain-containing protein n=1 Tax=Paraburkholderia sp. JHI869 TaxID=3112959 RepID=UPI003172DF75
MKLRQLVLSTGLAFAASTMTYTAAFAVDAPAAASDTVNATSKPAATSKKSIRAANRAFSRTVQKAIFKTKGLEAASIAVFGDAKTGHVTLSGEIASEEQDGLAVEAAQKVPGVTSVSSKLTVRQGGG